MKREKQIEGENIHKIRNSQGERLCYTKKKRRNWGGRGKSRGKHTTGKTFDGRNEFRWEKKTPTIECGHMGIEEMGQEKSGGILKVRTGRAVRLEIED